MKAKTLEMDSLGRNTDSLEIKLTTDSLSQHVADSVAVRDSLSVVQSVEELHPGLPGDPLPYRLSGDTGVMILLCFCFLFTAHVLSSGRRFLLQQLKEFVYINTRSSSRGGSTADDFRYRLILVGQTVVLLGISSFDYFVDQHDGLLRGISTWGVLGANIGICVAYFLVKWLLYSFLGWVFWDKSKKSVWMESYFVLLSYLGFLFFPFVLTTVYFDAPQWEMCIIGLVLLVFMKILLFYRWVKLFFNDIYGLFGLILYFCALELMPCLVMFKVLSEINQILLIKI